MKQIAGKDIFFCDKEGNYSLHSIEEILSNRMNKWLGWKCSAGINNLHITADGNIFAATCKVGGLLGNVFDVGVKFSNEWLTCTKTWCMCGADMKLLKLKSGSDDTLSPPQTFSEHTVEAHWIGPGNLHDYADFPQNITWDIGRRCNYHCSYCPPSTANNYEAHKSFLTLKTAVDTLLNNFCRGKRAKWIFTGGEPTINPAYMDIVKYIVKNTHLVHTQSNGSRDPSYFSELIEYGSIGFSIHFEEFNEKRLFDNCKAIVEKKFSNENASVNWLGIRMMVAPGGFERALKLKNDLLAMNEAKGINAINMSPLYRKDNGDQLMNYSTEELSLINSHS